MASWMIHFIVADALLDRFKGLSPLEFVFGNLAPDSGVPDSDGITYTPPSDISHFKTFKEDGRQAVNIKLFADKFLSGDSISSYSNKSLSFYLGYLSHLQTDSLWSETVHSPTVKRFKSEYLANKLSFLWRMKKDWYDLDCVFFNNNPSLGSYQLYKNCPNFENVYINIFPHDAFSLKQSEIVSFYSKQRDDLNRDYVYLSQNEYNTFVNNAVKHIGAILSEYL